MNENKEKESLVKLRQEKEKQIVLEQLRQIPIVEVACQKSGVSRATFYRFRNEDSEFKKAIEEAVAEGIAFMTDVSESQLILLVKEKNWPAISFWLRAHHPAYRTKIDVNARITATPEKLTPEQEAEIERAIKLASLVEDEIKINKIENKNYGNENLPSTGNQS